MKRATKHIHTSNCSIQPQQQQICVRSYTERSVLTWWLRLEPRPNSRAKIQQETNIKKVKHIEIYSMCIQYSIRNTFLFATLLKVYWLPLNRLRLFRFLVKLFSSVCRVLLAALVIKHALFTQLALAQLRSFVRSFARQT